MFSCCPMPPPIKHNFKFQFVSGPGVENLTEIMFHLSSFRNDKLDLDEETILTVYFVCLFFSSDADSAYLYFR